mmetsp:Transcript_27451/g.55255  ORF Transcript_27451/g.55255 Transcript_27451/m.55255 type:complete len:90 (+) Transcript_27451:192-461(+)
MAHLGHCALGLNAMQCMLPNTQTLKQIPSLQLSCSGCGGDKGGPLDLVVEAVQIFVIVVVVTHELGHLQGSEGGLLSALLWRKSIPSLA